MTQLNIIYINTPTSGRQSGNCGGERGEGRANARLSSTADVECPSSLPSTLRALPAEVYGPFGADPESLCKSAALVARLTDSKPILHRPCSWHTPQAELEALNRQYPGQVSHSMCDACRVRMEQEIA